jgi:hypothetical protein
MVANKEKDWRHLCAQAAEEPDSEKVVLLVNQILQAFDECDKKDHTTIVSGFASSERQ